MMNRRSFLGCLLMSVGMLGLVAAHAGEAQEAHKPVTVSKTFKAKSILLKDLSATLRIETDDGPDVRLRLVGAKEHVQRIKPRLDGTRLIVSETPARQVYRSAVHVENNVVITKDGGRSTVIIGGVPTAGQGEVDDLSVLVTIPRNLAVVIKSFSGNANVADLSAPFELELADGAAKLGQLRQARLAVAGSGTIKADRVDGALDVSVNGTGDVLVNDGAISALAIDTSGSATVVIGGRAGTAQMSLNGVADVQIAHVDARPDVDSNGIVSVSVGNW